MLISPSQCLTSNAWIFPSLSFISIKTEGSSTLLRELKNKKIIQVTPLVMMSSKQSLRLFFPLYNALLMTQIIRSIYIMTAASGAEDQGKWPRPQSYYYLRKMVTNSRKYDHVKCSTFVWVQLAPCQTAFISERRVMAEKFLNNHSLVSKISSNYYWSLKQLLVSKHLFFELVTSGTT